ncbi:MAG: hypothetical protein LBV12_07045 [Puniceicoccales bacterium]|jgi:hypothetical protein|nr:hypothetical protein [Puniceicoccales bacterium]
MNITVNIESLQIVVPTDAVSDLVLGQERQEQILRGLRAKAGRPTDRGNVVDVISFRVTRLHDSLTLAQLHLIQQAVALRSVPEKKPAYFQWETDGIFQPWLLNAVVTLNEATHRGQTTYFNYTLKGNWSTTGPT